MNNRSENVKKINKYIIISIVVFTFLVIVMFYRLTYHGSINNTSATYDYYTGVLPAVLIGFAGIDIIFYLIYLRDKLSHNSGHNPLMTKNQLYSPMAEIKDILLFTQNYSF